MTALAIVFLATTAAVGQSASSVVYPAPQVTDSPTLIDQKLTVEGRATRFEYDRDQGWNRFRFQGSNVLYRLPKVYSLTSPPREPALRVTGVLRKEAGQLVFDVTSAVKPLATDLDRLESAVKLLPTGDVAMREQWSDWASSRARLYDDEPLEQRGRSLAAEAFEIEARQAARAPVDQQIKLVRKARERGIQQPGPTALAHAALRSQLASATSIGELDALESLAREFLPPEAGSPQAESLSAWQRPYAEDPRGVYSLANPGVRAALDRDLLADIIERQLTTLAEREPAKGLALADQARTLLPDRPELIRSLTDRGLDATPVAGLTLPEVQKQVSIYQERGEPERARATMRQWLDARRTGLSASDVEGRLSLAGQYESLVADPVAADGLLREAWGLEPGSEVIAEAFRRRGYRRDGDTWSAPTRQANAEPDASQGATAPVKLDPYLGLTRPEVLDRLGKPDAISRVATLGHLSEQWTYRRVGSQSLRISFGWKVGTARPVVVAVRN